MTIGERIETVFGGLVGAKLDPVGEAAAEAREQALAQARRYPEYEPQDLVVLDEAAGLLTDGVDILQWMPPASDPILHPVRGFVALPDGPRYLRVPADGPATLTAWQRRQDTARREDEERAEERRRELEAAPFVAVDLGWLEGRRFPTLLEARRLVERFGRVQLRDGRLLIELRGMDPYEVPSLRDAVAVLHRAELVVVDLLQRGEELPDLPITPSGAPVVIDAGEAVVEEETPERRSRPRARNGAAGALA